MPERTVMLTFTKGEIALLMAAVHAVADSAPPDVGREPFERIYSRLDDALQDA